MKKLLLMRHAQASTNGPNQADHDRPLTPRGSQAARRMGALLAEKELVPERILSSSAERTRGTVAGLLAALKLEIETVYTQQLYLASPAEYVNLLRQLPAEIETVLLVGHNPGISDFMEIICRKYSLMPAAAIAEIQLDLGHWEAFEAHTRGTLMNLYYCSLHK